MKTVLTLIVLAATASAQSIHVVLNPAATKVDFTLGDVLHTVHGVFKLTKGDILVDPATGKASGQMSVSAASGDSGSRARDSRMDKNILETGDYPEITFAPDRLEGTLVTNGDSSFQLHGVFGIHGVTHELTMRVKSHIEGGKVTATADFDVPYVKWGMKDPSTLFLRVNNAVHVDVDAVGRIE